ncbi:AMIN-like domain-containing (lipo)protein [Nocardioides caldifontis]|uniref:AMIN-like domain-containing (lipo)protein n=1 Tax=Nocardioides caldifontis TaxID=2588938 RepID=UPI0011DF3393|nr:hypothetical protein [Nocardioides caldifontis]
MHRRTAPATRLGAALATAVAVGSLGLVAPAEAAPAFGTDPVVVEKPRAKVAKVVDLRWAEHPTFDRVVVDLRGRRSPGYHASHVRTLVRDGSGETVRIRGRHKFQLVLRPARTFDHKGHSLYEGPRHRKIGLPTLRAMTFMSDFEGDVVFGFGVRSKPFRVFTLSRPSRVVLDFKHPQ